MRSARLLLLFPILACTLDYEYGDGLDESPAIPVAGGELQILDFQATVFQTTHSGDGPSGGVNITLAGPWDLDVLAQTSTPAIPKWNLEGGDWVDLSLGATFSSAASPAYIDALFVGESGEMKQVRIEFRESLPLLLDREGLTRLDDTLSFTLTQRLHPLRWFPTINLTNLDADPDGVVQLAPDTNAVVYAQVVDALDKSARDWLDP